MKRLLLLTTLTLGVFALFASVAGVCADDAAYQLGPASQRQDHVPQGKVTEYTWKSQVFPGTIRRYWVYVPAQYNASEPSAVMVFQDGHTYVDATGQFRVPVVFDNLIHAGELPVIVGIFVDPGHKTGASSNEHSVASEAMTGATKG